ncbi:glycosyltransferase family 2 protein [Sphingomonas segetis]|jgi:glycosyltransferase involved in cell wall biosynthesis|uniref:glycosyltransferase family 2 protein n=1 Tax=Sphingomonas segetis TaxID=1104779 RepID=UPI0012D2D02E|nr:glycosyltransferase family 2 protein [Sphingomonas segetis]
MRHEPASQFQHARSIAPATGVDVTIVMPCLNEVQCLPHCIANANDALRRIADQYGLSGEIVVADNGSTDGSQALATGLGARVVPVAERGYGAALIGGGKASRGRYILMGDADGSYDFTDGVAMIGELEEGAELCMGSRFKGGITPGAMPWKNRYIGNPVLTGILKLFFRPGISDAHSGLRAIRKDSFLELGLSGAGMEFASEMVIKAALKRLRIAETPVKLLPDLRDRPPHLRPWRDGWRHLRYLFMLSPTWVFGVPALVGSIVSIALLFAAVMHQFAPGSFPRIGNYWTILAAAMLGLSHMSGILAAAGNIYGVRAGYRLPNPFTRQLTRRVHLESMLIGGGLFIAAGIAVLGMVVWQWQMRDFAATYSVVPAVVGTLCVTLGFQNVLGGFLLAIVGGNEAQFMAGHSAPAKAVDQVSIAA